MKFLRTQYNPFLSPELMLDGAGEGILLKTVSNKCNVIQNQLAYLCFVYLINTGLKIGPVVDESKGVY